MTPTDTKGVEQRLAFSFSKIEKIARKDFIMAMEEGDGVNDDKRKSALVEYRAAIQGQIASSDGYSLISKAYVDEFKDAYDNINVDFAKTFDLCHQCYVNEKESYWRLDTQTKMSTAMIIKRQHDEKGSQTSLQQSSMFSETSNGSSSWRQIAWDAMKAMHTELGDKQQKVDEKTKPIQSFLI